MKIIVIGGGIIGVTTALECAQAGADVTLLEKATIGSGASSAAGGILVPLYPWRCTSAVMGLLTLSRQHQTQMFGECDDVITSGLLCLDTNEYKDAELWGKAHGWSFRHLCSQQINKTAPGLAADSGIFLRAAQQVEPTSLLTRLRQRLEAESVQIMEYMPVQSIAVRERRAVGVKVQRQLFAADCVVVCAGAWSGGLCDTLPVRPMRGQMIEYLYPLPDLYPIVLAEGCYLIPRGGRLLVGSTVEDDGFSNSVTASALQKLSAFAERYMPVLAALPVHRQWAGLRPGMSRAEPLLGWHPDIAGVFLNTGHFRSGLALAAGSAWIAAQMIHGHQPLIDMSPFAL